MGATIVLRVSLVVLLTEPTAMKTDTKQTQEIE